MIIKVDQVVYYMYFIKLPDNLILNIYIAGVWYNILKLTNTYRRRQEGHVDCCYLLLCLFLIFGQFLPYFHLMMYGYTFLRNRIIWRMRQYNLRGMCEHLNIAFWLHIWSPFRSVSVTASILTIDSSSSRPCQRFTFSFTLITKSFHICWSSTIFGVLVHNFWW